MQTSALTLPQKSHGRHECCASDYAGLRFEHQKPPDLGMSLFVDFLTFEVNTTNDLKQVTGTSFHGNINPARVPEV